MNVDANAVLLATFTTSKLHARGHTIQFAGAQKTKALARRVQLASVHAATPSKRLPGLFMYIVADFIPNYSR